MAKLAQINLMRVAGWIGWNFSPDTELELEIQTLEHAESQSQIHESATPGVAGLPEEDACNLNTENGDKIPSSVLTYVVVTITPVM